MERINIQIIKKSGKRNILRCTRWDGSITWAPIHPGLEYHDLAHFAVESVLHLKNGFYGLINQGIEITDFELPMDKRPKAISSENLPQESIVAEHLVNLIQVDRSNSDLGDQLIKLLKDILFKQNLPFPQELNKAKIIEIRKVFEDLSMRWYLTPDKSEMALVLHF